MRKWLSVLLLLLLITAVNENTFATPKVSTEPVIIKPFAHGDGA